MQTEGWTVQWNLSSHTLLEELKANPMHDIIITKDKYCQTRHCTKFLHYAVGYPKTLDVGGLQTRQKTEKRKKKMRLETCLLFITEETQAYHILHSTIFIPWLNTFHETSVGLHIHRKQHQPSCPILIPQNSNHPTKIQATRQENN